MNQRPTPTSYAGPSAPHSPTDYGPAMLTELRAMRADLAKTSRAAQTCATTAAVLLLIIAILIGLWLLGAMVGV